MRLKLILLVLILCLQLFLTACEKSESSVGKNPIEEIQEKSITLLSPTKGETLQVAEKVTITWESNMDQNEEITLLLRSEPNTDPGFVKIGTAPVSAQEFEWEVDPEWFNPEEERTYKIEILLNKDCKGEQPSDSAGCFDHSVKHESDWFSIVQ